MDKTFLGLTAFFLLIASVNVSAYYVAVSNDGWNLYLTNTTPSPYNDIYYYNKYTVSPKYYANAGYPAYPSYAAYSTVAYGNYGLYSNWYGGYYGYVTPVTGYYSYLAEPYMYQYYTYQPMPLYCTNYWCYS